MAGFAYKFQLGLCNEKNWDERIRKLSARSGERTKNSAFIRGNITL